MAIYHLHTSVGTRAGGQSAAAKCSYINREGKYEGGAAEVVHAESGNMPAWARDDPSSYWVAADAHERSNGRLFREVEFALPVELSRAQQVEAARKFASRVCGDAERFPYSLAIHRGSREPGKPDNPHCHLVLSERGNDGLARSAETWFKRYNAQSPERGGARKSATTQPTDWLKDTRERWAEVANGALARAGHADVRIHEGTLEAQWWDLVEESPDGPKTPQMAALERAPGIHVGPAASAMERKGRETERGGLQREIEAEPRWREALERWQELVERLLEAGRDLADRLRNRGTERETSRDRLERFEQEWERIAKLHRDAMAAEPRSGRRQLEREAREAKRALEREIRELPWAERLAIRKHERAWERGREEPSRGR